MLKKLFIIALILLSWLTLAQATIPVDVVFDIDQTIATLIHQGAAGDLLAPSGKVIPIEYVKDQKKISENYRVYDGLVELLQDLKEKQQKGLVRVSFFSGGESERNAALLEKIILPDGTNAKSFAYKILNRENMTATGVDETGRVRDRFKKDLRLVNSNLDDVILVDDIKDFVLDEQRGHVLWIDEKFPYTERVYDFPPETLDKKVLDLERHKYNWISERLHEALDLRIEKGIPLPQAINQLTENGKLTPFSPGEEKVFVRGKLNQIKDNKNCAPILDALWSIIF